MSKSAKRRKRKYKSLSNGNNKDNQQLLPGPTKNVRVEPQSGINLNKFFNKINSQKSDSDDDQEEDIDMEYIKIDGFFDNVSNQILNNNKFNNNGNISTDDQPNKESINQLDNQPNNETNNLSNNQTEALTKNLIINPTNNNINSKLNIDNIESEITPKPNETNNEENKPEININLPGLNSGLRSNAPVFIPNSSLINNKGLGNQETESLNSKHNN